METPRPSARRQSVASSSAAEEARPVAEVGPEEDEPSVGAVAPTAAPEVGPEEDDGVVEWENVGSGSLKPQWFLPNWKKKQSSLMKAQSKQRPKPQHTDEFKREVNARSADDRKRLREKRLADDPSLPWDVRGPPGPKDGGPQTWRGQSYRANTARWANSGGRNKEKYDLFRSKQREGLTGKELQHWHPMSKDGYWARKAADEGVMAPWEEKEL